MSVSSYSLVIAAAALLACSCKGRNPTSSAPATPSSQPQLEAEPDVTQPHIGIIRLDEGIAEQRTAGLLGSPRDRSLLDLLNLLRDIRDGKRSEIKGLLVSFGSATWSMAHSQELGRALDGLRAKGISITCHGDGYTNASYWVAAQGCDDVWVSPWGSVNTVGIAAQVLYMRRLFDELKIDVQMLQVGKYKGASEPFTQDGPTPEARQSLRQALAGVRNTWMAAVTSKRKLNDNGKELESGPYTAKRSKELGLVDHVGYLNDAKESAYNARGVRQSVVRFGRGAQHSPDAGIGEMVRWASGAGLGELTPRVQLIYALGEIGMQTNESAFGESGISWEALGSRLRRVRQDPAIRSVVLRIDSPGGSALASDLLWNEIIRLREVKPVIISIGSMAASGGYYLACAGTHIYAEPSSIVGSIGVVGGKFSIHRTLDHFGVTTEVFPAADGPDAAARAAFASPMVPWDETMLAQFQESIQSGYDLFVDRIRLGRKLPVERIDTFAQGRLFAGVDAKELGMIDAFGGLHEALDHARRAGGLDAGAPVDFEVEPSGLEKLLEGDEQASSPVHRLLVQTITKNMESEVSSYMRGMTPLLNGEHVLLTVPFALSIR